MKVGNRALQRIAALISAASLIVPQACLPLSQIMQGTEAYAAQDPACETVTIAFDPGAPILCDDGTVCDYEGNAFSEFGDPYVKGVMPEQLMPMDGNTYALEQNAYTMDGYSLVGWDAAPDSDSHIIRDGQEMTNLSYEDGGLLIDLLPIVGSGNRIVLHAVWAPDSDSAAADGSNADNGNDDASDNAGADAGDIVEPQADADGAELVSADPASGQIEILIRRKDANCYDPSDDKVVPHHESGDGGEEEHGEGDPTAGDDGKANSNGGGSSISVVELIASAPAGIASAVSDTVSMAMTGDPAALSCVALAIGVTGGAVFWRRKVRK
jgi:hypothetical protein